MLEVDEWATDRMCELLNNTETFQNSARGCATGKELRRYVAWLYGSSADASVAWTREHVPDLDAVDWDAVWKDVNSE